jgi:bifunctional non-homologous end joining protein LigD
MAKPDLLNVYRSKRDFSVTPEPGATHKRSDKNKSALSFVVQKHWASRLHYDFRLELGGTMKSWAVPKGPSFDPHDKRMAVHVEDHPISYNRFEGQIPAGQYGAGKVIIWDKGVWMPLEDPEKGYRDGKLKFELHGHKLKGCWALVRMKNKEEKKQEPWLLIKEKDEYVRPASEYSVVDEMPDSVAGLELPELQKDAKPVNPISRAATLGKREASASSVLPDLPKKAIKAVIPLTLTPQLATLVDGPPNDPAEWAYEIKFDGYRLLTRIEGGKIQLFTRNGNDWSNKLPHIVKAIGKMGLESGWLDGEVIVPDEHGIPDFQALQNAFDSSRPQNIIYYLFDIPFFGGYDLRALPLVERREYLKKLFETRSAVTVRLSETFDVPADHIVASACRMGLEGVIGKRKTSTYVSRRSPNWIKLKCSQRQEFVIGGYTDPQGSRVGIGSLLLGFYDEEKKLRYAGNVGTGFSDKTLRELKTKLGKAGSDQNPFAEATGIPRNVHWVKPELVAEVSFGEWTREKHIRHSVFQGLRIDKKAGTIIREKPVHSSATRPGSTTIPASLRVTHPERVIDPSTGFTKMDLVRYYGLVGSLMMEHLKGRPVSLVRAPDGVGGQLFFQKHLENDNMPGVNQLDVALDPEHPSYLEISTAEGLMSAAQMNVIEFHTWNAAKNAIGTPDRMTFDLDPGEGVQWGLIQESAQLVRIFLEELGLKPFLKTSGGKGLHIVVPIKKLRGWDTVKDFSHAIVQHLANTIPQRFVAKSGPSNRKGKIFIDYLRNGFGATTVSAWSVRARPGVGVSVPAAWDELQALTSAARWSALNIHGRLDKGNTPWADYESSKRSILPAMKALGFKPHKEGGDAFNSSRVTDPP